MSITISETEVLLAQTTITGKECLAIVNGPGDEFGVIDAENLLEVKLGGSIATRFKRLNTTMTKLLDDVRLVFPDAQYYTASGGFNLMLGNPHDDKAERGQQELVALNGGAQVGDGDF